MRDERNTGVTTADIAERHDEKPGAEMRERVEGSHVAAQTPRGPSEPLTPLFPHDRVQDLRNRWHDLQVGFVDDPRHAVQQADQLVAQVMQDLARGFADERAKLEHQWDKGDQVSTEDLRVALQRYRSFFERFLSL
jgi:hypothetical protein